MLKSDYRAPEVNYPINWTKGDVDGNTSPFDWEEFNDLISITGFTGDDK